MMTDLNTVRTTVYIDRQELSFETLRLYQAFNEQNRFEIVKNFGSQQAAWLQDPEKLVGYVGQEVYIKFEHMASGAKNQFFGIVTHVEISGDSTDTAGGIRIIGSGQAILLEGVPEKRSFTDMLPNEIVQSILADYRIPFKCNASKELKLPYAVQYDETAFSFLNRLSKTYGEWFYDDGYELIFGKPEQQEELMLDCDADVTDIKLRSSLRPRNTHKYAYETKGNEWPDVAGNKSVKTGIGLLKNLVSVSDRLFNRKFRTELEASMSPGSSLSKLAERESTSYVSDMLCVEASTRTCRVKIGHYVNFNFPGRMNLKSLGQYVVTEVEHIVNRNGHYENRLVAHPSNPVYVPAKETGSSRAYAETGVVVDNADPEGQGRVRVQFEWQQGKTRTNWLRVQTPDAGSSDKVSTNRGFVAIPEIGDQVMVGYEHGNPSRPFVMGSLFHGKSGTGGGAGNKIKSLSTRSGNCLELNDEDGSVSLKDPGSANLLFDGKGNATTNANVSHTINAGSTNMINVGDGASVWQMDKEGNISLTANTEFKIRVGESTVVISKDGKITVNGKDIKIGAAEKLSLSATDATDLGGKKVEITGSSEVTVNGAEVKINK
ncbi:hypothetical protein HQ47_04075 [Porphyromonas macacae]|uniref:Gp5/Type VI secretion system Vgr protein OB-fold domain-containing protein n=2 Tax=Porphyromonas macacae TaxID=28115 RepID=A0A0A2ECB3_9PORP|nr:hypothetical protein HQ47_04075 [Porphyromonas macacae]